MVDVALASLEQQKEEKTTQKKKNEREHKKGKLFLQVASKQAFHHFIHTADTSSE